MNLVKIREETILEVKDVQGFNLVKRAAKKLIKDVILQKAALL